jgi:hypothetical protein
VTRWLEIAALAVAGCGSPEPFDQPPRFVVMPYEQTSAGGAIRVGVGWILPDGGSVRLTDVIAVAGTSEDFSWAPVGPPPDEAMRSCDRLDCVQGESAAVGWLLAFVDEDDDGAATVSWPDAEHVASLQADGADRLVGIATDHVVAYAPADLTNGAGLARSLGWPVLEGAAIMGSRLEDGRDLLSPVTTRERVALYLLQAGEATDDAGLCCAVDGCDHPDVHCPSFPEQ